MPDHIAPKGTTPVPYRRDTPPPRPSRRELLKVAEALLKRGPMDRRALLEATGLERDALRQACTYLLHVREIVEDGDVYRLPATRPTVETPRNARPPSVDLRAPPPPITRIVQPPEPRPLQTCVEVLPDGRTLREALEEKGTEAPQAVEAPAAKAKPRKPRPAPKPKPPPKPKRNGPLPKARPPAPPYMDPPPPIPADVYPDMRRAVQHVYDHPGADARQIADDLDLESHVSAGAYMRWAARRGLVQRSAEKPARWFPPPPEDSR